MEQHRFYSFLLLIDTSNIWALVTVFPIFYVLPKYVSCTLPVSLPVSTIYLL